MRWKFVIPALLIVVLIVGFNILFIDGLLKRAAIAGGQSIFGAKVEIQSLKTRFSDLSITVRGIAVADKNDVWRNLFQADRVAFGVKPLPLLSKKFLIEEMSVEGVRWGTKRSTSGQLPPRKVRKINKKNEKEDKNSFTARLLAKIKEKGNAEVKALPSVEAIRDAEKNLQNISVEKLVTLADLQSLNEMSVAANDIQKKYTDAEKRLNELKIDEKAGRAAAAVNEASKIRIQSVQDIETARRTIDKLNQSRQEMEKTLAEVQTMKQQAGADWGDEKQLLAKINELKDRDYRNISAKMKLPSLSFGNISQYIFGPVWIGRVNDVVYYMHVARKYMPQKSKKNAPVVARRAKGTDVRFPVTNRPPDFLIQKIVLSGSTGGEGKTGEPMDFAGVVTDVTSDPAIWGRPVRLQISGTQGGRKLMMNGVFDHTGEIPSDRLDLAFTGLTSADIKLPQSDYLPSFEKGNGSVLARFELVGEQLGANLQLALNGLSFAQKAGNDEINSIVASLWAGITGVSIEARLTGTADNLEMSVASDIDKILSERFKNVYGAKVAELQNRVRAEVDRLTAQKQAELMAEYTSRKDALLKDANAKENEVRGAIDGIKGQIQQKENAIRDQGEREKKKAEEEIKKKAGEKLKELFKR
jgi:uncharacterized protein (TIGR03545 family)